MADYDNTNSGAAFKAFDTQKLILRGKLNNGGKDEKIVLVADETKSGKKIIEVYAKVGVLFENDKNGNDKAPDYSGPMENGYQQLAGWKRTSDNAGNYMSLKISDKSAKPSSSSNNDLPDDDIPF